MPKLRPALVSAFVIATAVGVLHASPAGATVPDPTSNFATNPACSTTSACVQAAITVLDQARARLGQPAYQLPGDFAQLSSAEQAFVLTNLDRVLYGLTPIPGLTDALDQTAADALSADRDPVTTDPSIMEVTSNWAGGYRDLPLAYEAWMYNDGPGSPNLACTALDSSGCWQHRHNILASFDGSGGALAMGAAAGTDFRGQTSYAMLIVRGDSGYRPDYVYTWSQALAAGGAGGPAPAPAPQAGSAHHVWLAILRLRVRGHALAFRIAAPPGVVTSCALTRNALTRNRTGFVARYARCGHRVTYRRLPAGAYRLRVRAGRLRVFRAVRIG